MKFRGYLFSLLGLALLSLGFNPSAAVADRFDYTFTNHPVHQFAGNDFIYINDAGINSELTFILTLPTDVFINASLEIDPNGGTGVFNYSFEGAEARFFEDASPNTAIETTLGVSGQGSFIVDSADFDQTTGFFSTTDTWTGHFIEFTESHSTIFEANKFPERIPFTFILNNSLGYAFAVNNTFTPEHPAASAWNTSSFSPGGDIHWGLNTYTPPSTEVPEPGSMLLLGMGAIGALRVRRKKSQA